MTFLRLWRDFTKKWKYSSDALKQATLAFANAQKQYNNKEIDEATYKQSINTWADAMAAGMNLNTYYGLDSDKNVNVDLN